MRILSCFLLLSLCLSARTAADADTQEGPYQVATKVIAAYEAGDMDRMRSLAQDATQDPWFVADFVCMRGSVDAAMVYARAAQRQDAARLPAYLEQRKQSGHDEQLRALVTKANAVASDEERKAALEQLSGLGDRGDPVERVLIDVSRANLFSRLSRAPESAEAFTAAGRTAERIGWLAMAARSYHLAGLKAHHSDDVEGMLAAWTRLHTVEQGRANPVGVGRALILLGTTYTELGDFDRAVQRLGQAERTFTALKDPGRAAWALDSLGLVLKQRGEYGRALAVLERGLELAQEAKNPYRVAHILNLLGALHSQLDDHQRALGLYQEAHAIFKASKNERGMAQCVGNMGIVHADRGAFDKARALLQAALDVHRTLKSDRDIAVGLQALGSLERKRGRLAEAKALLIEAHALARKLRDEDLEAHALQNLAQALVLLGEHQEAAEALAQSGRLAARLASPRLLMENHRVLAELLYAQKKYGRAVHAAERALEHTLSQLVGLAPDQAAIARDSLAELFEVSLKAAVATGRPEAVFAAIEGARAGALLESLENRDAIRSQYVPEALRQWEMEASRAQKAAARAYQKAVASGQLTAMRTAKKTLDDAGERLQGIFGRIQREARTAASVLYPVASTLAEAQALLATDEALVSYSLMTDPAVALVVTAKKARIVVLTARAKIVAAAGARFDDEDADVAAEVARLQRLLVAPLQLAAGVRRVLIAPDGILGYVPFSLLTGERQVAYVPSATTWRVLRSAPRAAGQGVLALGDPDYRTRAPAGAGVPQRGGMALVQLPATRKEAQAITSAGDVVLLGAEATRGRFLMAAKTRARWRSIHLACHGLVDGARPMRSALALAFDKDGGSLLTCGEVFNQRLQAELAVLSACETGRGTIYRVEGIVGLTQAFMLAGSPRVLVSLWRVDDEATQALMQRFYELWNPQPKTAGGASQAPLSAAAALREAQDFVRGHKQWRHPYYWGAWVLWGLAD